MEIRFSCHAKNKIRLYKLTGKEVEEVVKMGKRLNHGNKWESRLRDLRVIWLMVGSYALVVTVIRIKGR